MTSIVAIVLAALFIIPASAQSLSTEQPLRWKNDNNKTIVFKDKVTGEQVGSAFVSGSRTYFRDRDNKHYATVIKGTDGTLTWLDPSGQPLDPKTTTVPW